MSCRYVMWIWYVNFYVNIFVNIKYWRFHSPFFCHVFPHSTTSHSLLNNSCHFRSARRASKRVPSEGCKRCGPRCCWASKRPAAANSRRRIEKKEWSWVKLSKSEKSRWEKKGDVFEEFFFICLKVLFVRIVFELNFCFVTFLFLLIILIHLCLSLSLLPEAVQTIQRLANGERVDDAPLARLLRKLFQKPWAWLLAKRGCVKEAARHKSCFVFVLPFFWERLRLGSTYVKLGQFIAYWPQRQTSSTMTKQEIRDLNRSIMIHMIPLYGN